ncbi:hypothetical protein AAFF_G00142460 [Aldrovandia affinis]|uniref:Uncharacterized protein n=1 Tax=Aldrovandia affinis TaxID=143900 RepID=A0AAD7T062_9TELE|nr:hypothetical protein AAFF_G00142460 [Aldrovandia affinis]
MRGSSIGARYQCPGGNCDSSRTSVLGGRLIYEGVTFPRMQQELWLRAKLQVLNSLKPVSAMTPATTSFPKARVARAPASISNDNDVKSEACSSRTPPIPPPLPAPATANPIKASRTHQELHKELLLAHKKGLVVGSKPELQLVLERRKRERTVREEGEQARTPLEQVLLKRQQVLRSQKENQQERGGKDEPQLLEFVKVRQNLRKIHSALYKPTADKAQPNAD